MTLFRGIRHQRFQMRDGEQRIFEQNPHIFKTDYKYGHYLGLENSSINVCI